MADGGAPDVGGLFPGVAGRGRPPVPLVSLYTTFQYTPQTDGMPRLLAVWLLSAAVLQSVCMQIVLLIRVGLRLMQVLVGGFARQQLLSA